jgi:gliding motility-associated-like protein
VTYTINGGSNQTITLDGTGLASANTGALTTDTIYELVSVTLGSCSQAQTGTATVTINIIPTVTISGTATVCSGDAASITFSGMPNATITYTVDGGPNQTILLDSVGTANLDTGSLTSATTYSLVSFALGTCSQAQSGSVTVTVNPLVSFTIEAVCLAGNLTLQIIEANFDPTLASYNWTQGSTTVGTDSTLNVEDYIAANPTVNLPLLFSLSVDLNGCFTEQSFTVNTNPCGDIPKGVSINGDGLNDTFNLTGYGVKELSIFNRYGMKVYSFSGAYTTQWRGQTDDGKELPDGTYYYSIHTTAGTIKTGWVYIIRSH